MSTNGLYARGVFASDVGVYGLYARGFQNDVDATAPVLSAAAGAASNDTEAGGSVSSDEAGGTLYWVVTQSATGPSVAQVQAGQDELGAAADDNGSQSIASTGSQFVSASGLTAETTYYFHFQADDALGNDSTVVSSASFDTPAAGADDYGVHFRDARYRNRLSWGLGCVLLLLMAQGCIQPPRREVYDSPCLRPDYGQLGARCPN